MADVIVAVLLVPPALILGLIGLYLTRLFLRQQQLVFRPRAESVRTPSDFGLEFEDVFLECASGVRVHGWWVAGPRRKAIIYFHGSDGNLSYELATLRYLVKLGVGVFLIDYPGYGQSGGSCSERHCNEAGDAAWSYVRGTLGVPASDIFLFGQSLGTAVATYIASTRECGGLVFQSGFTSVPDLAATLFPRVPVFLFRVFARTRMNSLRRISRCRCPVLVLHSRGDEHIPLAHAMRIHERAGGITKLVEFHGAHFSGEWRSDDHVSAAWQELLDGATSGWERRPALAAGGAR